MSQRLGLPKANMRLGVERRASCVADLNCCQTTLDPLNC